MILRWRGWTKKHFVYTSSLSGQGINLRNIGLKSYGVRLLSNLVAEIQWCHLTKNLTWDDLNTFLRSNVCSRFLGFLDDELFMGNMSLLLRLIFSRTNFCLIVQDVCYLTVLSLHVLALWSLCSKLGLWSFKHEFSWLWIWISNCELNRLNYNFLMFSLATFFQSVNLLMDIAWDVLIVISCFSRKILNNMPW